MSVAWALEQDPRTLAIQLVKASRDRPGWLAAFAGELETQALADPLRRLLDVWGLSASEAARLFMISRQELSRWLTQGVPTSRLETVADLSAATDLLVRYLKLDRIPSTVRRKSDRLGGLSLLDLVAACDIRSTLEGCRAMVDFSSVQG
jgi:hypothetical protein